MAGMNKRVELPSKQIRLIRMRKVNRQSGLNVIELGFTNQAAVQILNQRPHLISKIHRQRFAFPVAVENHTGTTRHQRCLRTTRSEQHNLIL